ncbi:hypothetical protein TNCV_2051031 [Trichonephila clavipes]|nr:hypothetical protein TNCV_2051031 [Trichonephila clavipes]
MTKIPRHTSQYTHRQQYGRWDSITILSSPVLFPSADDHVSEKPTIAEATSSFETGCSNFLSHQRTQENNTVFQTHRT